MPVTIRQARGVCWYSDPGTNYYGFRTLGTLYATTSTGVLTEQLGPGQQCGQRLCGYHQLLASVPVLNVRNNQVTAVKYGPPNT
ncbi:hypothetical protein [Hymenobacter sp. BRD67]|uniref:hypothetical protein n=1 Tax=Hymenobacter sp. BRD67 TaxID=2675877 RepID=UPI0015635D7D|nr:hypothetical protein [Hymenobacter sp. BRD67]QKG53593.1 hypothetical protein GKZ67_14540 [Hymenobacter sp. BRD67]